MRAGRQRSPFLENCRGATSRIGEASRPSRSLERAPRTRCARSTPRGPRTAAPPKPIVIEGHGAERPRSGWGRPRRGRAPVRRAPSAAAAAQPAPRRPRTAIKLKAVCADAFLKRNLCDLCARPDGRVACASGRPARARRPAGAVDGPGPRRLRARAARPPARAAPPAPSPKACAPRATPNDRIMRAPRLQARVPAAAARGTPRRRAGPPRAAARAAAAVAARDRVRTARPRRRRRCRAAASARRRTRRGI